MLLLYISYNYEKIKKFILLIINTYITGKENKPTF